ncbi:MAG: hypothetical protein Q4F66_04445 [Clostridium sp.]|nr:hypothetical protein [Clostridium sp.]
MSHKRNKNFKNTKQAYEFYYDMSNNMDDSDYSNNSEYGNNNKGSILWDEISDEDKQSLRLLMLQLKSMLIDLCGTAFIWNSTIEGIEYILERYDGIEGNEHSTNLEPDMLVLQGSYIFLYSKLINTNVAFTRFNTVWKKKVEGNYRYSLEPNYYVNAANILNLLVSYYYIRAAKILVSRDNRQPVYGI